MRISCYIIHASLCWVLTPPEIPSWARPVTTYVHPPAQIRAASAPQATRRVRWIGLEMSWIDLINVKKSEMSRLHDQNIWDNVRIVRRYRQSKEQQADVFFEGVVIPAERWKGLQYPQRAKFCTHKVLAGWPWRVAMPRAWKISWKISWKIWRLRLDLRSRQRESMNWAVPPATWAGRNICRFSTDR